MLYLDCESTTLRGTIFASALINDSDVLFDGFYRHECLKTSSFHIENDVEGKLTGTEYPTLAAFQAAFAEVWNAQTEKACVCHMGAPVESNFFQQLFEAGLIGEFGGMYPMLDTASLLYKAGYDPTSELAFCAAKGLELPGGKPHSALFDARVTKLVWSQL